MNDITLFPADIAAMSVSQLAALPAAQKAEIDKNLDEGLDWLKKARAKFDAALDAAYGEQARAALRESGRDFGTAHIVAAGDQVEHFIDVKLAVSESRFTNWPPTLQQEFAAARTVEPGKPSFTLSFDSEH